MKKLFSILVLALSCSALFAQQTAVALLNHEGTLTSFYGANALADAHKAAVHGDVITLSGGSFAGITFSKAVTVRGAGMIAEATGTREITYINSPVIIRIPTTVQTPIIFESLYFLDNVAYMKSESPVSSDQDYCCNNSTFNKCRIDGHIYNMQGNANFYNCFMSFNDTFSTYGKSGFTANINIVNSVINSLHNRYPSYCKLNITNCIITYNTADGGGIKASKNVTFKNCIFTGTIKDNDPTSFYLPTTVTATNCISCFYAYKAETSSEAAVYYRDIFSHIANPNSTNKCFNDVKEVFKTYNGNTKINNISVLEKFELTDEAKAILGSDGKEVGVHGGIGFDLEPTTLQITKCEVSPKVSENGKLAVSIEVGLPK